MCKTIKFVSLGLVALVLSCAWSATLNAQESAQEHIKKIYTIFFPVGEGDIRGEYKGNEHTIQTMLEDLGKTLEKDGSLSEALTITASTSPEGALELNQSLAMERAFKTRDIILQAFPQIKPQQITLIRRANDWSGMVLTMKRDTVFQYREQLLEILTDPKVKDMDAHIRRNHPEIYAAIKDQMFENMRTASVSIQVIRTATNVDEFIDESFKVNEEPAEIVSEQKTEPTIPEDITKVTAIEPETPEISEPSQKKSLLVGAKTNLFYDLAATPNVGLEFYLGKNWSIVGNWMYAWWHSDPQTWYWRTYGGDIALRKWFGKASKNKPLTGHHVGVYGQMLTYDFLMDEDGILADKWNWAAGLEYGYSVPLARRLNMDFTLGAGYHWGEFKEYIPLDGHYVWQATKKRRYMGPTKIEISLVWLIGGGDKLPAKGGKR